MKKKNTAQFGSFNLQLVLCSAAVCSMITGTLLVFFHLEAPAKASDPAAAGLTFAERVAYQRAIEEVYWRHRIWPKQRPDPKPTLDAVMSQAQIESKVQDYFRKSQALEDYWQRPITAEQLQVEMNRMAQHTKQPDVLRELFQALGNDPFVIAECLARPALAEGFVTNLDRRDQKQLGSSQAKAKTQVPREVAAIDSIAKAVPVNRPYHLPAISSPSAGCIDDTWTATSLTNASAARSGHTAVWTGSEMIVWGGLGQAAHLNTDWKYNPRDPSTPTPTVTPIPYLNTGARYNPSTDTWTATSTNNAPTGRADYTAVWTGSEMIVWGGINLSYFNTGGRYNPGSDSWSSTTLTNAPNARWGHTAVWTGSEMIVWGGYSIPGGDVNTGGRYNPTSDSWIATPTTNAPDGRDRHIAVWTGSEMIVWGGTQNNGITQLNTGGRYNIGTNGWTPTTANNAPDARFLHTGIWSGNEMIVWGGVAQNLFYLNTGGRYSPGTGSWTVTSTTNVPSERAGHTAIWTGDEMIVWGGYDRDVTGGRYNPDTDTWTATSTTNAPPGRDYHTAVWTGSEMIVWGGQDDAGNNLNTGGRYCARFASPTPTATPTVTPTATATATSTATPTSTPRPSPTPRPALTPRPRPTPAPRT
jgi:N-acetylneuraminic acid mutarotase